MSSLRLGRSLLSAFARACASLSAFLGPFSQREPEICICLRFHAFVCVRLRLQTPPLTTPPFRGSPNALSRIVKFFRGRRRDSFTSLQVLQTLHSKRQKHPFSPYELQPRRGHPVKRRLHYLIQLSEKRANPFLLNVTWLGLSGMALGATQ